MRQRPRPQPMTPDRNRPVGDGSMPTSFSFSPARVSGTRHSPIAGSARTPGQNRNRRGLLLSLVFRLLPIGITSGITNALNYFPALFRSERIGSKFHRAGTAAATGMGRAPTGPPQRVSETRF